MLAVMGAGSVGLKLADALVWLVKIDAKLVAVTALAMLGGPAGIVVFLAALGSTPGGWQGIVLEPIFVVLAEALFRGQNQGGINDLTASNHEPSFQQLPLDPVEQGLGTGLADAVGEDPDGCAIGDDGLIAQSKALLAHPIQ